MIPPRPDCQKRMAAFDAPPVTVPRLRRRGLKARQIVAAIVAADRRLAKGGAL